jgi:hypothetical protein
MARTPRATRNDSKTLCVEFPLRPGYRAQVVIPVDMTHAEAERLQAFIRSLAQDDTDAKPATRDKGGA